MAKSTKSGLGRGLNSLLGGSFEEGLPDDAVRQSASSNKDLHTTVVQHADVSRETSDKNRDSNVDSDEQQVLKEVVNRWSCDIPVDRVIPNPDQPRTNFKKDELEELAASIQKNGLLQPILVRPLGGGRYQIIAGERRWQASKMAGLSTIPARIKEVDDDTALELALIENVQRSDLNPIEEAYGYKRLMERRNLTQSEVAQEMSKGRSTVANALRLLELPEDAQQLLFEEKITAGHARAILSIPSKEGRQKLTEKLREEKLTVRETEAIARLMANQQNTAQAAKEPLPKSYKTVAKALKDVLQTNVRIKTSNGKNKIEIEFKDEADLERLFEELIAAAS